MPTLQQLFSSRALTGLHGLRVGHRLLPDCGPVAISTCLNYMGCQANEAQVADALGKVPATGYQPPTVMEHVSSRGIRCLGYHDTPMNAILAHVRSALPVLVLWPDRPGHWVIPCGYEQMTGHMIWVDPGRGSGRFWHAPLAEVEGEWTRPNDSSARYQQVALFLSRISESCGSRHHPLNRRTFRLTPWAGRASTNRIRESVEQALAH